jgi:hypothetical protein
MATQDRRHGVLAFARQTAVGVPASAPTYALSIEGGGIKSQRDRATLPTTRPTSMRSGQFVQRAWGAGEETIIAHETAMGLLLYEACFSESVASLTGAVINVGDATINRHRFQLVDTLPGDPLTIWSLVGDEWELFTDAFVNHLVLRGGAGDNVAVVVGVTAFGYQEGVAAPTYTLLDDQPRAKYIGATTFLEADAAPPIAVTTMESYELEIVRTLELRYGGSLTPKRALPIREVNFSGTVTYDSAEQGWDFYHAAKRGAAAVGGPTQQICPGSFAVRNGRHPLDPNGNRFLQFYNGPPVAWNPVLPAPPAGLTARNWEFDVERPDADPGGGFLDMQVAGPVRDPGAGATTEVTIELFNDVVTAYNTV